MILSVCVKLNENYEQGRDFRWIRPHACPRCHSVKVWGHGFVMVYFDGFASGMWLRRFRCPDCNCINRMKPKGCFPRFQVPIDTILACLASMFMISAVMGVAAALFFMLTIQSRVGTSVRWTLIGK